MKRILLGLLVLGLAACDHSSVATANGDVPGILGGGPVAPGMPLARSVVAIHGNDGERGFLCTGVLITKNKVLTAGHCGANLRGGQIAFSTDLSTQDVKLLRPITDAKVQPQFGETVARISTGQSGSPRTVKNLGDLAVLTFSGKVPEGYRPVDIAGEDAVRDGVTVLLAGFGVTDPETESPPEVLQAVAVRVKMAKYSDSEFTVDQSDNKGACHGDSGGPAFVANKNELLLVGITSRGLDDACGDATIYTRVSSYLDWIQEVIRE